MRTAYPRQYMRNSLYLNTGGKAFGEVAHMAGLAGTDWTWSVKFGDLDNDGWIDLIGTNGMTQDRTNSDFLNQAQPFKQPRQRETFGEILLRRKTKTSSSATWEGFLFPRFPANGASTRPE